MMKSSVWATYTIFMAIFARFFASVILVETLSLRVCLVNHFLHKC